MAIVKEWLCMAHGDFEGPEPVCPRGCTGEGMVERAFRTPPAIQSQGYRNINTTIAGLAQSVGMSDIHAPGSDGMRRRLDPWAERRRQQDIESLGVGRLGGSPIDQFFRPISEFNGTRAGAERSILHKAENGSVVASDDGASWTVPKPKPRQAAGQPYDGTSHGLPPQDRS